MFRKSNAWKDWRIIIDILARVATYESKCFKMNYKNIQNVEMNEGNQKTTAEQTLYEDICYTCIMYSTLIAHSMFHSKATPTFHFVLLHEMYSNLDVLFIRLLFAICHTRTPKWSKIVELLLYNNHRMRINIFHVFYIRNIMNFRFPFVFRRLDRMLAQNFLLLSWK